MHSEIVFGRQSKADAASELTGTLISCPINTSNFAVDMMQLSECCFCFFVTMAKDSNAKDTLS
jgi:hypothetical protein